MVKAVLTNEQILEIHRRHLDGDFIWDLSKEFKVSISCIYSWFDKKGLKTTKVVPKKRWSVEQLNQAYKDYQDGLSITQVARKYNTQDNFLGSLFHKAGFKIRTVREQKLLTLTGKVDGKFKGWINPKTGYRTINLGGEKPRFEHDLVWSSHNAGLPIPKGMVVHHINGNKLDNRIENLALLPNGYHVELHAKIASSNGLLRLPVT